MITLAATPRDEIHRDGTARLYRFRRPEDVPVEAPLPLLVVPSLINRWYIVDLRPGASLVEAMVAGGLDTWCLDWGIPEDEDRYLTWEEILDRLGRAIRVVKRRTGAPKVGLLGYCMGATLAGIYTALHPEEVAAFCNLAGPFDFSEAGLLGHLVDQRWFDPAALTAAGNLLPIQMQSGFVAMRPTAQLAKWVRVLDQGHDPKARVAFDALETWAGDNIPFPASAYVTYIQELYQKNLLVKGHHHVRGQRVDLGNITCPVLSVVTQADTICPPAAAVALNALAGTRDQEVLSVAGGHVGAVVGSRASRELYPGMRRWFLARLQGPREHPAPPPAVPS